MAVNSLGERVVDHGVFNPWAGVVIHGGSGCAPDSECDDKLDLDWACFCPSPESLVLGCGLTWSHGHAVLPAGAGPGGRRGARGVAGGIPVGPGHVAPDKDGGVPTLHSLRPVRLAESRRSTLHAVFFRQLRPVGWAVAVRAGHADLSEPEGTMNEPAVSRE